MKSTLSLSILVIFMLINTVSLSAQYCVSKSNAPWELWIKNVQLNTINYESEKYKEYSSLGYSDYTNINTVLTKGMDYQLSTEAGMSWLGILNNTHCRAWIDWNRNNTFEDTELVLQNKNLNPFVTTLRVPATAQTGATRMRIAVKMGDFSTPCETFGAGEVEDYTVTIAETNQPRVFDLAVTNLAAPSRWSSNQTDSIRFDIKNMGSAKSSEIAFVYVTLVSENPASVESFFINYLVCDTLAPNASQSFVSAIKIPNTWKTESASFTVSVQAREVELNTVNNKAKSLVFVPLAPLTCGYQISTEGTILCFDNSNPNAIKINVAEGNTILQKTVDKNGQILNSAVIGNLVKDSILVVNNQIIKKLRNGNVAYSKTITPSVLNRFPKIEAALEMPDGSFVLAGLQRFIAPQGNLSLDRDSLVLVTTDAQLNYQESSFEFKHGGAYVPKNDTVLELIALPNVNEFVLVYYFGTSAALEQKNLYFSKYQKNNFNLVRLKEGGFGRQLVDKLINFNVCGNNVLIKTDATNAGGKGSSTGVYTGIFNLDSLKPITSRTVGSGSADYYGSFQTYNYYHKPSLTDTAYQIIVNYAGDPRIGRNNFTELEVKFYDNARPENPLHTKIIPFVPFEHIIRTGDTSCLVVLYRNGQTFIYNPDCNNSPNILPDLTLKNLNPSTPSVQQGQILAFTFDAKNIGAGNATDAFTIKSFLSTDQILDADDYQDGTIPTANYAAGATITQVQGAMKVGSNLRTGRYYLILKIDADNQIRESYENNNVVVSPNYIDVTIAPNVVCRYQDSLQLVSLYNSTNGANWVYKWDLNKPMNTWRGVDFTPEGCVYLVSLSENNLVGSLPNLNLPNLNYLYLYSNRLSGSIPDFNLPNLLLFNANNNQLSGTIPNFNLPNLTEINLNNNQLSGTLPNFNLPKLFYLRLNNNQLSGAIPNFNLPNLYQLHLNNNQLSGIIPNFNLPNLTTLGLYVNQLTGSIPNFNCPNLAIINLSNNQLNGLIPNFNCPNLRELVFFNNELTGSIPSFNYPNLNFLNLSNNQLSGCIPTSLKNLCGKYVNINFNPNLETQDFTAFCSNSTGACINVVGGGNGTNDIALSLISTPSVYRQYTTQNFKISAKNNSNQAFTNVKIDFPYPKKTVNGGVVTPSVGTWQEWCAGGTQCYTWTIPSLAANTTATLDVPVYVLDAVGLLTASTHLLSSNPADNVTVNNSVTILIGSANTPLIQPLIHSKPIELNGQLNGELHQTIYPTIADNYVVLELESDLEKQINCQIINSLGSVVLTKELILELGNNKFNFIVSQLPKGMYFIQTSLGVPMKFVKM